jgi:hypothetical protein
MKIEKGRIGLFFILVGLVLWVIFFTTDQAKYPSPGYFFIGVAALFLGGYLWWRDWKAPPEAGRFRSLRRMRQKRAERSAKKKKKKEDQQAAQ